jgi:hypothetical protein
LGFDIGTVNLARSRQPTLNLNQMNMIRMLIGCAALATCAAAQVPEFVILPESSQAPNIDRGYDKADPTAFALALRSVQFSGRTWYVKSSSGRVGPGPNYFSDSPSNVWVDDQGRLHLKITKVKNQWHCAEVISEDVFGHGTYTWELDSPVDSLDRNVVLGLFTWGAVPPDYGEIDIEFARWGSRRAYPNAQYVVQPFDLPGHMVRFDWPPNLPQSTHRFLWAPEGVLFESFIGHGAAASDLLYVWPYAQGGQPIPSDTENARMNLWLYQGNKPSDGQTVEVIIKSFHFEPLQN